MLPRIDSTIFLNALWVRIESNKWYNIVPFSVYELSIKYLQLYLGANSVAKKILRDRKSRFISFGLEK